MDVKRTITIRLSLLEHLNTTLRPSTFFHHLSGGSLPQLGVWLQPHKTFIRHYLFTSSAILCRPPSSPSTP